MSNFIYITLDTTAPTNPTITIEGGSTFVTSQLVDLEVSVGDTDTTGYQMKIWGDVDTTYDDNVQDTEESSSWTAYSVNPQIKLSSSDGSKTINIRVRDDVHNASSVAIDDVSLDTNIPTVTTTTPDVNKISKKEGKNVASFTFSSNEDYVEYKVKLVGSTGATHDTGSAIGTASGSINVFGTTATDSGTITTVTLNAGDLETAGANMNGENIIKVFVKDKSGQWSA